MVRSKNLVRLMSVMLGLALVASPAAADDPVEPETAVGVDGHGPDDPEELGAGDHDHGLEDEVESLIGSGTLGPYFNESGGCADPSGIVPPMSTTNSSANRSLPSGHQVRGPWGDFYGRDYGDVAGSMVRWTVPMSGGTTVQVHERALPAFQQVTANLAAESAKGNYYNVRIAASFVWRRVGGSYRMSTHAFGSTIDINWDTNPYSSDNVLITDMPDWFVKAWTDAGFCWGGDWQTIKDTMHFSWKGPMRTDGYGELPSPYPPITAAGDYTQLAFSGTTTFGPLENKLDYFFGDGNTDGAPDLFRVRDWADDDLLVEYTRSSRDFEYCGLSEAVIPGAGAEPGQLLLADYDGDARPDVWRLDTSGAVLKIIVHTYAAEYRDAIAITTAAVPLDGVGYGAADYDQDGLPDLYVVERKGDTVVRVYSSASGFTTKIVDADTQLGATASQARWHYSLADIDVDGIPDLVGIRVEDDVRLRIMYGDEGYTGAVANRTTGATAHGDGVYTMGDWDGDGRPDLLSYRPNGYVQVHLGGVQTGSADSWFQHSGWTCDGSGSMVPWDVNGDRIADLVVGVPNDDVGAGSNAGLINVLYGTTSGPSTSTDTLWHQDSSGIESSAETNDRFGSAMAWGDFDNDGIGDLAVGAPYDDVGTVNAAGLVNIIYGTSSGLSGTSSQMFHQDTTGIQGTAQGGDHFGAVLAAGDFDGDGWDDLAVGAPDDLSTAGVVNVIYGTKLGLTDSGNQLWYQDAWGVPGSSSSGDGFGSALAVGDFDDDGYDDLAVGVPGNNLSGAPDAGAVIVLYGSASGLASTGSDRWIQSDSKIADTPDPDDRFGASLAAGDYDGDGFEDLAIGAPGERVSGVDGAGQIHVIFGRKSGLNVKRNEIWNQDSDGVPGTAQKNDEFGAALASGDMDRDGFDDLAIGVWLENVNGIGNAGAVTTMFGRPSGLAGPKAVLWRQGFDGLTVATSETGDRFGTAVRFADLNGDGYDDLIVGMPREDLNEVNVGAVVVIYSGPDRLTPVGAEVWHQDADGVEGTGNANDKMGSL